MHFLRPLSILPFLILSFGVLLPLSAQTTVSKDILIPEVEVDNMVQGRVYSPHYPGIEGSQFLTENWIKGDYRFMDKDYLGAALTYDLYLDDLILLHKKATTFHFIRLHKSQVQGFNMGQRIFINKGFSSYKNIELKEGYYEVLLEDRLSFLIKRQIKKKPENAIHRFVRNDKKFLIIEGAVYPLSNKKSLLRAVGKQYKKNLTSFMKKNKIYPLKASDEDWTKIVVYLNELI